uniref:Uncharacterized protein n=1 Tax=Chromera velia CCMP2878 TaxID=1169474 RepID=A0A0G4HEU4_9ALVE|eukprot:Cvel_26880.t1-p1 / transcript=Cvel_26880.t1 / gene=Cvel_26880 / organism=Chromera_velia_CCMP2878 / gene_product=hypothetical protein / transcript_product=hypothetical protein / location=Cvel_scaffold3266:13891-15851(+) / protein_length=132 / sequence_SO=supercontig / SO=protein_coding / is_pseudo=false
MSPLIHFNPKLRENGDVKENEDGTNGARRKKSQSEAEAANEAEPEGSVLPGFVVSGICPGSKVDNLAEDQADNLAEDQAEDLADNLAEDLADNLAEDQAEDLADNLAEDLADNLAEDLIEDLADVAEAEADK